MVRTQEQIPSYTSLVCVSAGGHAILEGAYPELVLIAELDSLVSLRGDIGNDTGSSVIIALRLSGPSGGSFTGDVTFLTHEDLTASTDFRPSPSGARPTLIASNGIDIAGNREAVSAIVWAGGRRSPPRQVGPL